MTFSDWSNKLKGKDQADSKRDVSTSFRDGDAMSLKTEKTNCLGSFALVHSGMYTRHDGEELKRNSALVKGYNVHEKASLDVGALSSREGEI